MWFKKKNKKTESAANIENDRAPAAVEEELESLAPILTEWLSTPSDLDDEALDAALRLLGSIVALDSRLLDRFILLSGVWKPMADGELQRRQIRALEDGKALLSRILEAVKTQAPGGLASAIMAEGVALQSIPASDAKRLAGSIGFMVGDASTASRQGVENFISSPAADQRARMKQVIAQIALSMI